MTQKGIPTAVLGVKCEDVQDDDEDGSVTTYQHMVWRPWVPARHAAAVPSRHRVQYVFRNVPQLTPEQQPM